MKIKSVIRKIMIAIGIILMIAIGAVDAYFYYKVLTVDENIEGKIVQAHQGYLEVANKLDSAGLLDKNLGVIDLKVIEEAEKKPLFEMFQFNQNEAGLWDFAMFDRESPYKFYKLLFYHLNSIEVSLMIKYPKLTDFSSRAAAYAMRMSSVAFPDTKRREFGFKDAYRHIFWAALVTKYAGEDAAALFYSAHEMGDEKILLDINNIGSHTYMDYLNNEIGRKLGIQMRNKEYTEDELVELVKEMLINGQAYSLDNRDLSIHYKKRDIITSDQFRIKVDY